MWSFLVASVMLATPAPAEAPRLVFLGDSLTAGYGLDAREAFPALIQERIKAKGWTWTVVNAGVSGDTTAGALRRLDRIFRRKVDVLFVCLGANDGLRGLPPETSEGNLRAIVARGKREGAQVVVAGMRLPENYGPDYRARFEAMYARIARQERVPLLPFLLEDVALHPELNQNDGIHPNAEGTRRVAGRVWSTVAPILERRQRER
ncbi:MAG TPA: arylesterase [Holophaga sp.]|jgi:acyl-CoA thioesterase I|nr:arylesterase [Holophaga sp.]HQL47541.1 arylesterase [Holophaga sp.]